MHRASIVAAPVVATAVLAACWQPAPDVVINELHFHPVGIEGGPEITGLEFIELFNRGRQAAWLEGWRLDAGVRFEFPATTIEPGGYLVVAADTVAFAARRPGVAVVGDWDRRLANSGELVRLVNSRGRTIDEVVYADQGEWATRERGVLDRGHRGWAWDAKADGGGHSLELVSALLTNDIGANWSPSREAGGTPGAVNSRATEDGPPLISEVRHEPVIPRSDQPVRVRAEIRDEGPGRLTARVLYRLDGEKDFHVADMGDDGAHHDGRPGDGLYAATIPAFGAGSVVEFLVTAEDASGQSAVYPRRSEGRGPKDAPNLLYQVLDEPEQPDPHELPVYRLVLTAAERAESRGMLGERGDQGQQRPHERHAGCFRSREGTRFLRGRRSQPR